MSRTFMTALLILLLPFWGSTAEADNRYMPIEMDLVEDEIAKYDPDISVLEDDAWRDDQKVYSLKDCDGNIIAFLSSIGENTEGTLQFILMDSDVSESGLYEDTYQAVIKSAVNLFDDTLDADQIYDDFTSFYHDCEEDFEWTGTYQDTNIIIRKSSDSVELTVFLYNSEKYSPLLNDGTPEDYSTEDPVIGISEISGKELDDLFSTNGNTENDFSNNPDDTFYRIDISDLDYHTEYKVDVSAFVKFDLSKPEETVDYVAFLQNNPSEEYHFPDITGSCRREADKIEGTLGIPVVERISGTEVQYKERFNYTAIYHFSLEDLEDIEILPDFTQMK